jgi:hypothetical protein
MTSFNRAISWTVYRCGSPRPIYSVGAKTIALGNVRHTPIAGNPYCSRGAIICPHFCLDKFVAERGYDWVFHMVVIIANHASDLEMCLQRMASAQFIVVSNIFLACCLMFPSGARSTPKVVSAWVTSNWHRGFLLPLMSLQNKLPGHSLISLYLQVPPVQIKSVKYQNVFFGTIAPHVAFYLPSHVSIDFCIIDSTSSYMLPLGKVCIRSVSSTKE